MLRASKPDQLEKISLGHSSVGIAVCWLVAFGVFVFYGAQTRYGAGVVNAMVAQDDGPYRADDNLLAEADPAIITGSVPGIAPRQ
jgi:hypothetical protein